MHPMFEYQTLRRGREELLRQAEQERMIRRARVKNWMGRSYYRKFASWLGGHMVRWGKKLENFGKNGQQSALWPVSPHH